MTVCGHCLRIVVTVGKVSIRFLFYRNCKMSEMFLHDGFDLAPLVNVCALRMPCVAVYIRLTFFTQMSVMCVKSARDRILFPV